MTERESPKRSSAVAAATDLAAIEGDDSVHFVSPITEP